MSDAERPGSAIERYIPAGELADRQSQELALVGLSPDFPLRISELNEAIVQHGYDTFSGFRFSLSPDEHRPKVDVEARYHFPYEVVVEADTFRYATLSIASKDSAPARFISFTRLSYLREFFDSYPNRLPIALTTRPRKSGDESQPEPVTVPFTSISSVDDLRELGLAPSRGDFQVGFDTPGSRFSMSLGWHHRVGVPDLLAIEAVKALDRASAIEAVIGSLAVLLSRDAYACEG